MSRFAAQLQSFFYDPEEDVSDLFVLDAGAEAPSATATATVREQEEEFLTFMLGTECYAVPLREVREIVKVPPLTEVPHAPRNLLGVMNLRGEVLPVYDVKVRLQLASAPPRIAGPDAAPIPKGMRIVVARGEEGDAGILVDSVADVTRLKPSEIEPPPSGLRRGERQSVVGLGRRGGQLLIVLDVEQTLS